MWKKIFLSRPTSGRGEKDKTKTDYTRAFTSQRLPSFLTSCSSTAFPVLSFYDSSLLTEYGQVLSPLYPVRIYGAELSFFHLLCLLSAKWK